MLLLTNRYGTMAVDARLVRGCCSDAFAYRDIARAFPGLPDESRNVSFHHAQRLAIPWLTGGVARTSGLSIDGSFRVLALGLALAIVLMTLALLREVGAGSRTQVGLLAMFVFNAYAFRFGLAFPWYVSDLGFVLGVVMTLFGLVRGKAGAVLAGIVIAAISRQTTLLILAPLLAWLAFAGDVFSRRARLALAIACPMLAVGIYEATGRVASNFATTNINIEKITAIFRWFARDFSAGTLAEFVVRLVLPLLPVVLLGTALAASSRTRLRTDLRFWLLISMTVAIAAQPAFGDPEISGGNAQRLTMLGFVPLLAALALLMAVNRVELPGTLQFWTIFGTAAFVSSLHHIHSFIGQNDSDLALIFAIAFVLASVAMAVAAWVGWRTPAARTEV